jgi:hypothetical protein
MTNNPTKRLNQEEEKALENILEDETSGFFFLDDEDNKPKKKKPRIIQWFLSLPYRIRELCYSLKYFMQRFFRPYHLSDIDLWNFDGTMAKWIYPRFKKFIVQKRHGYPGAFSEYHENEWKNKEAYDNAIKNGEILGGGPEAWEKILQEMIFAFEWKLHYQDKFQVDEFCKKWNVKNPHEKCIENKSIHYEYKCLEPNLAFSMSDEMDLDVKEPEKYQYKRRVVQYYNTKLEREMEERATKGFELFGKYFLSLWD